MSTGTTGTGLAISIKEPYDNGNKGKQENEEKLISLEKFGSSTSNKEYGNNQSSYSKPTTTATISALTTNDSAATTATATATNDVAIYRLGHSDIWVCKNCKIKADKHFMQIHDCSGKKWRTI